MIRRAGPEDRPALEAVYDQCFPGEPDFRRWFFDTVWRPEATLLWEEAGSVLSNVQDIPVTMTLDGRAYPAHYIYAAGTAPQARGRGLMAQLLNRAFQDGQAAGQWFSVLITQNERLFDFYRPFGYTTLAKVARHEAYPGVTAGAYRVRPARSADLAAMLALYNDAVAGHFALNRDLDHMARMLALYGDHLRVLEDSEARVAGYAFLEEDDGHLFVKELVGHARDVLAVTLCNHLGTPIVFQGIVEDVGIPIGCVKALNPQAQALLRTLPRPPYINMMYN